MKTILVTGIGGVVGQGILRNIQSYDKSIRLVGTNTIGVSSGNHLCNLIYVVPFAYEADYISRLLEICTREKVDLIIPSTDYESYYLSENRDYFLCPVAASPASITKLCLDKYDNYLAFQKFNIPFAQSVLPSKYLNNFTQLIAKPREGRGSRDIHINPSNISSFDDSYVIQEYLNGPEITTTFYVTQNGRLHGHITLLRELDAGNTSKAEVTTEYNSELDKIITKILEHYDFRGSCNIQSRVTSNGIIPFEINCRISGTNSIRSQFGFKDVLYTIEELLYQQQPTPPTIVKGCALRVFMDVIYPDITLADISTKPQYFYIH